MDSLITRCCSLRLLSSKSGFLMWVILLMIFNSIVITPGNGLPVYQMDGLEETNADYLPEIGGDMEKRSWDKLQGGWGKRAWENLHGSGWGKRGDYSPSNILSASQNGGLSGSSPYYLIVVPSYAMEKRGWKNLQGGWGKRNTHITEFGDDEGSYSAGNGIVDDQLNQINRQNQMSSGRQNKPQATKRDPGWNNLKGMWG